MFASRLLLSKSTTTYSTRFIPNIIIPLSRNPLPTYVDPNSPSKVAANMAASFPILTEDPTSWIGKSLVSVTQITPAGFDLIVKISQQMRDIVKKDGGDDRLKHKLLATVFYEASTRTSCSFQAAMMRLGGKFLHVDGQGNSSAAKKKESLEDTIKCLECYVDVVVLRHPVTGSVPNVCQATTKPLLNAGDGINEHPTQALLDSFTIWDELQNQPPKIVVFLGDLKHGRTVHSLAKLLVQLCSAKESSKDLILRFCSPKSLEAPTSVLEYCDSHNIKYEIYTDLIEASKNAQVLYVTRVQKERFDTEEEYDNVKVRIVR